jgi:N-acetylglucosamine kinase-like BadF-type ATPase
MVLIADSGSTKTHWCVIDKTGVLKQVFTKGINPFYQTEDEISKELELVLIPELKDVHIESIYFYGAGCSFPDKKAIVSNALVHNFNNISIEVQSDLLGAARSLFGDSKGIACILGTGSNSCLYDGKEISENVSPLGFILGDEGSGAVLGKTLIADCLKNQLPVQLKDKFMSEYELTPAIILENVYKKPFPNRYLAKFSPFLLQNIENPSVFNIIYNSFDAFFVRNVQQYECENMQVSFIGSVAYYFRDTLEIVASERGLNIGKIEQSPMDGLVEYHKLPLTPKGGIRD